MITLHYEDERKNFTVHLDYFYNNWCSDNRSKLRNISTMFHQLDRSLWWEADDDISNNISEVEQEIENNEYLINLRQSYPTRKSVIEYLETLGEDVEDVSLVENMYKTKLENYKQRYEYNPLVQKLSLLKEMLDVWESGKNKKQIAIPQKLFKEEGTKKIDFSTKLPNLF